MLNTVSSTAAGRAVRRGPHITPVRVVAESKAQRPPWPGGPGGPGSLPLALDALQSHRFTASTCQAHCHLSATREAVSPGNLLDRSSHLLHPDTVVLTSSSRMTLLETALTLHPNIPELFPCLIFSTVLNVHFCRLICIPCLTRPGWAVLFQGLVQPG